MKTKRRSTTGAEIRRAYIAIRKLDHDGDDHDRHDARQLRKLRDRFEKVLGRYAA